MSVFSLNKNETFPVFSHPSAWLSWRGAGPGLREGGGARPAGRDGVAMGSKMAAAARVVQVGALGRRPGAGGGAAGAGSPARAAGLARSAAARARGGWGLGGRRRGRCPWRGEGGAGGARTVPPVI